MRLLIIFLINIILSTCVFAQQQNRILPQPGKIFISRSFENLEILSDSTLITSIWHSNPYSIYQIKNDTLLIKEAYNWLGPNNNHGYKVIYHDYKVLKAVKDTIILQNNFHGLVMPHNWEDPLVFVNLEKFRRPMENFRFLKLNYANVFDGNLEVSVDSNRKISYKKSSSPFMNDSIKVISRVGYLSLAEFENFKKILSLSLITMLPDVRGCNIDEPQREFSVFMNNKIFTTKGCTMYYPQIQLFNYLYQLNKNNGVKMSAITN